jgi:hypothetical protein
MLRRCSVAARLGNPATHPKKHLGKAFNSNKGSKGGFKGEEEGGSELNLNEMVA